MSVVDRDFGFKSLLSNMMDADGSAVFVGIRQAKGAEVYPESDPSDAATMAEIATINEFGSPEHHIPERSFLRATLDENEDRFQKRLGTALGEIITEPHAAERALGMLGEVAVGSVQARMAQGIAPALSPVTIAERARKGRPSTKPLIDTGRLRQSIEYEVRVKGREVASGGSAKKGRAA